MLPAASICRTRAIVYGARWMRFLVCAALLACDPQLAMSDGPMNRRTIEGCPEAVDHLRACCPQFGSYLSCTVLESWTGARSADLSERQSRCLRSKDCSAIEKAVTKEKRLCDLSFQSRTCQ